MILKRALGLIILKMRNGLNGSALGQREHFYEDGDALSVSVERGINVNVKRQYTIQADTELTAGAESPYIIHGNFCCMSRLRNSIMIDFLFRYTRCYTSSIQTKLNIPNSFYCRFRMPNFVEIRLVISYLMHGDEFVKQASTSGKERIIIVITFVAVPLRFFQYRKRSILVTLGPSSRTSLAVSSHKIPPLHLL